MNRCAAFWSWLDEGRCRLCDREGRATLLVDLSRVRTSGDSTSARRSLVDHARAYHPEYVGAIGANRVFRPNERKFAEGLDNVPDIR